MKLVIRWIALVWTIVTMPYLFEEEFEVFFFGMLYAGLLIYLLISDLRDYYKLQNEGK